MPAQTFRTYTCAINLKLLHCLVLVLFLSQDFQKKPFDLGAEVTQNQTHRKFVVDRAMVLT